MNNNSKSAIEIERKYVIEMPDLSFISDQPEYTESDILQIYLTSAKGETSRIRKRVFFDRVEYTKTTKIRIDAISSNEIESEISEGEFDLLALQIRDGSSALNKTRHTFSYLGNTIEIDIYPQWQRTAIMETELDSADKILDLPPFIKVIKEVTGDKSYSNSSMASSFPPEL